MYETWVSYGLGAGFALAMAYGARRLPTRDERRYWTVIMALVVVMFPPFPLARGDAAGFRLELAVEAALATLLVASRWRAALLPLLFLLHGLWDLAHLGGAVAIEKPRWATRLCVPFDLIVALYLTARLEPWRKGRPGMHPALREAFAAELAQARAHKGAGRLDEAFAALERAHVLGQRHAAAHALVHCWMLRVGLRRGDAREVLGQLLRIPTGALGSALGVVPTGNTGGADVPALRRMPIPPDVQRVLDLDAAPEAA